MSDPRTRAALDMFLIPRILIKLICAGFAAWIGYLAFKTPDVIKIDQDTLAKASSTSTLKGDAALNASKMLLFNGGSVVFNYALMIPFLIMKWHHPSQSNPNGRLQKMRPSLLVLMGGQFILAAVSVPGIFMMQIGLKGYTVETTDSNPAGLIANLGISQKFTGNPFFMYFYTVGWGLVVVCVLNFCLELMSFIMYKGAAAAAEAQLDYSSSSFDKV